MTSDHNFNINGKGQLTIDALCDTGTIKASGDIAVTDNGTTMNITKGAAQTDLDIITGADGATLATAQGNYAPAKAGDSMDISSISGDSGAADNLEADYDGGGYTKPNSTIGTTTTNTDMRGTDGAALAADLATVDGNVDDILALLDNRMVINKATSELWLYNAAGDTVIKKWPLTDKDGSAVVLQVSGPANRGIQSL